MVSDRGFTNPNFGKQIRVEVWGKEVQLIFTAGTLDQANDFAEYLVAQLTTGAINLTLMGKPTSVEEVK